MYRPLDILRAMAVWLMVANHLGVAVFGSMDGLPAGVDGWAVTLGSYAPVIFFFGTGVGYGLKQPQAWTLRAWLDLLLKSVALVMADQFLRASSGSFLSGLDFLAFIGLSMLIVGSLSMTPIARPLAVGCIALALASRFLGPNLGAVDPHSHALLRWLTGSHSVAGISYPWTPWIVYPMLGFLAGRWVRDAKISAERLAIPSAAMTLLLAMAAYVVVERLHMIVFRWGTVSFGFFVLSLAVLGAMVTLVLVLDAVLIRLGVRRASWVAVSGLASLAVVPIHYALIGALRSAGFLASLQTIFLPALCIAIAVSIWLASRFARVATSWVTARPHALHVLLLVAAILFMAMAADIGTASTLGGALYLLMGQLTLCTVLAARRTRVTA